MIDFIRPVTLQKPDSIIMYTGNNNLTEKKYSKSD